MKELLFSITKDDFIIETFKSGGKGGQHQNKTESGVRIKHPESNSVGESRTEKSQHQNKIIAFRRLLESDKWKIWFKKKCSEVLLNKNQEEELLEKIEKMMSPQFLKIEQRINGKWEEIDESEIIDRIRRELRIGYMDAEKAFAENDYDYEKTINNCKKRTFINSRRLLGHPVPIIEIDNKDEDE